MWSSYVYPTNNFGNHNNTNFYFYSRYVTQGNNWSSYGLHQVELRNETDSNLEVVGWKIKEGRVEEDFKTNIVRPGLFYSARLVPNSWGTFKSVLGALTVKVQGTNQVYTLAFEDPFHDYINKGYKGHIEEGNEPDRAISNLKDNTPKTQPWGRYEFSEFDGRGKTVLTITNLPTAPQGRSYR
jgi:hypothetical protein